MTREYIWKNKDAEGYFQTALELQYKKYASAADGEHDYSDESVTLEEIRDKYQKALELEPDIEIPYIYIILCSLSAEIADKNKSRHLYKESIEYGEKALEFLQRGYDEDIDNLAELYQGLTISHYELGELNKALEFCKKGLSTGKLMKFFTNINQKLTMSNRSNLNVSENEDLQLAASYVSQWMNRLESGGRYSETEWSRSLEDLSLAKTKLDKILRDDPTNIDAKPILVKWYAYQGRREGTLKDGKKKAIKYFQQGIELDPQDVTLRVNLGITYGALDQWDKAVEQFEKADELMPGNIKIKQEMDRAKSKAGSGCFIATAVYGSPLAADVILFRWFRDTILDKNKFGKRFIHLYYEYSPSIAEKISSRKWARNLTKYIFLKPLSWAIKGTQKKHVDCNDKR